MARPQLGNLNPGGTISTTGTLSITSGNPLLKPFRAKTFDTSLSGTTATASSAWACSRRTSTPTSRACAPTWRSRRPGCRCRCCRPTSPATRCSRSPRRSTPTAASCRASRSTVQQPFTFLPGALKNFGVLLNYTRSSRRSPTRCRPPATTITDDLLNLSPRSWNATLYYDDGTFSARVSGSTAAAFLTRVPGPEQQRRGRQERSTERGPVAVSTRSTSNRH
jgi:iron complex outermembrane receptor protein